MDLLEAAYDEIDVVEEFALNISNDGDDPLEWWTQLEVVRVPWNPGPRRDDPGDLIGVFRGVNAADRFCSPVGWDPDNEWMWVTKINPNLVVAYTHDAAYQDFQEVMRFNPGVCTDGAFAAGLLYLPVFESNQLSRYTAEGANVGVTELPFPIVGVAVDPIERRLFLMNEETLNIHVFQMTDMGDVGDEIGVIDDHQQFHGDDPAYSIEWLSGQLDGQLWMTDSEGRVYQISVDTDDWSCMEVVQSFIAFPDREEVPESGIAFDSEFLWAGGFSEDNIRIYDAGVSELQWLGWDPQEGWMEPGSDMEIMITINSVGMIAGEYESRIHFISNDFRNPDLFLTVRATFVGVPGVELRWPASAGYPELIDFNAYGPVWVGLENVVPISIWNRGTDDLTVNEISFGTDHFICEPEAFVLPPHRRRILDLAFIADEAGMITDSLLLRSNAPGLEEFLFPIRAEAVYPPVIDLTVQAIELSLGLGEEEDFTLGVNNNGGSVLRWVGEVTPVTPGRDEPAETIIRLDPVGGTVQPEQSQDVQIHFELVALDTSDDAFTLTITSNDPQRPVMAVDILIHSNAVDESEGTLLPAQAHLDALHPNPFNSTTTVDFSLPARSDVGITLLDLEGREVLELARGAYDAGSHSIKLDAGQLPAGCYLVRLVAGNDIRLSKAVIVK